MFVQVNTDNRIRSDSEANSRLEERIRQKLQRFEERLSHAELFVSDVNADKGGTDKKVTLEVRPNGLEPLAVHSQAERVEDAVNDAAEKVIRALEKALGRAEDARR